MKTLPRLTVTILIKFHFTFTLDSSRYSSHASQQHSPPTATRDATNFSAAHISRRSLPRIVDFAYAAEAKIHKSAYICEPGARHPSQAKRMIIVSILRRSCTSSSATRASKATASHPPKVSTARGRRYSTSSEVADEIAMVGGKRGVIRYLD